MKKIYVCHKAIEKKEEELLDQFLFLFVLRIQKMQPRVAKKCHPRLVEVLCLLCYNECRKF